MEFNSNDTSPPVEKTLAVLELFSRLQDGITLKEAASLTGIAQATLLRILNTLVTSGYLIRLDGKKYISNFNLSRYGDIPGWLDSELSKVLQRLCDSTGQSAEIITVKGDSLFWYDKLEPPEMPIRISAKPGFKRQIYELDAPSRCYLNYIGASHVAEKYDTEKFYNVEYKSQSWSEAVEIFSADSADSIRYDRHGNSNGIRRYAALVTDQNDNFCFILSIAEAAVPVNNTPEHIEKVINALEHERNTLIKHINK